MKNKKDSGLRKKTHNGVDSVVDKAEGVGKSSKQKIEYLKKRSLMMKNHMDSYIQKHPQKSILMATGIGIVAGAILAKTLMKRK